VAGSPVAWRYFVGAVVNLAHGPPFTTVTKLRQRLLIWGPHRLLNLRGAPKPGAIFPWNRNLYDVGPNAFQWSLAASRSSPQDAVQA